MKNRFYENSHLFGGWNLLLKTLIQSLVKTGFVHNKNLLF